MNKLKYGQAHKVNGKIGECARCGKKQKVWLTDIGQMRCMPCAKKTKVKIELR